MRWMSVNRYVCLSRPTADKEILEAVIKNLYFSSYIMTSRTDKKSKKQGSPAFLMLHRFSGRGIATETPIFYYTQQGKPGTVALEFQRNAEWSRSERMAEALLACPNSKRYSNVGSRQL